MPLSRKAPWTLVLNPHYASLIHNAGLIFFSCGNFNADHSIIGTWKVTDYGVDSSVLSPLIIEQARKDALTSHYLFKKDGTFNLTSSFLPEGMNGKYELNVKEKMLKLNSEMEGEKLKGGNKGSAYEAKEVRNAYFAYRIFTSIDHQFFRTQYSSFFI